MDGAHATASCSDVVARVRGGELEAGEALGLLAAIAEPRASRAERRRDGSYFTAADVGTWLARRAICSAVADAVGSPGFDLELGDGGCDLHTALEVELASHVAGGDRSAPTRALAALCRLEVLDPTCGAGALLCAALRELVAVERILHRCAREARGDLAWQQLRVSTAQLHGLDRDALAVEACHAAIEVTAIDLGIDERVGAGPEIVQADALAAPLRAQLPELDTRGGADVVIGNPPYVRAAPEQAPVGFAAAHAGNVAAWVLERALDACAPGARIALVLPISAACTDAWSSVRTLWHGRCVRAWASHFDCIPSALFPGVVQRITLLEGRVRTAELDAACTWWSTTYHRWRTAERVGLLDRVRFHEVPVVRPDASLPKVGSAVELDLLARLACHPPAARLLDLARRGVRPGSAGSFCYKRRWSYFLLFTDFVPGIWDSDGAPREPTELKAIAAASGVDPRALVAIYSSTLFWWWFSVFTDNRNVNVRELASFPVPVLDDARHARLAAMGGRLLDELRACAEVRECTYGSVGTIRNTYFRQGATRPVLDVIDRELAEAYGMLQRELDHVLAFERRFRS